MTSFIEDKCIKKGVRLTGQRKIIAQVMANSTDHPAVDELHKKATKIDKIATKLSILFVLNKIMAVKKVIPTTVNVSK